MPRDPSTYRAQRRALAKKHKCDWRNLARPGVPYRTLQRQPVVVQLPAAVRALERQARETK